jgi:hypothetical protein
MKKNVLFAMFILPAFMAQAAIFNVSNNPDRPAGYIEYLQAAINLASAGDTIYIYPSAVSYGDITITKKLHLFGSGYINHHTAGHESILGLVNLDTTTTPSSNPSGSTFCGLSFKSYNSYINCQKANIHNISIIGNYFYGNYTSLYMLANCNGWFISNNFFWTGNAVHLSNSSGAIISNNIFNNTSNIIVSSSGSVVITNNLFFNWQGFSQVYNATVSNNIFLVGSAPNATTMTGNNFINNLIYWSPTNNVSLPLPGNIGSNNLNNIAPQFLSGTHDIWDNTKDYRLSSGSPARNAGTDGTDMGPYGGTAPFVNGGAFTIPKIAELQITNPVINQATPINVKIKARKADL